jgi:hypothetical protein
MTRMPFSVPVRKFLSNDMAQDRGERNRTVSPSWKSEVEFVVLHILISGHILLHIKLVSHVLLLYVETYCSRLAAKMVCNSLCDRWLFSHAQNSWHYPGLPVRPSSRNQGGERSSAQDHVKARQTGKGVLGLKTRLGLGGRCCSLQAFMRSLRRSSEAPSSLPHKDAATAVHHPPSTP